MAASLTIDFFHDVVCAWCFNTSSRMRTLAEEFNLDIRHRTFVLQASREEMRSRWGSPEQARETILGHWTACRQMSDQPELINIRAMRDAPFDYPHGFTAALACKAAERTGGQRAHWDMFDQLQRAHLAEAKNVADPAVALQAAQELGLETAAFAAAFNDPVTERAVQADRRDARSLQVSSIPALIIRETGTHLVNGSAADLRAQLKCALRIMV